MRKSGRFIVAGGILLVLLAIAACAPKTTPHPPTAVLEQPAAAPTHTPAGAAEPVDTAGEAGGSEVQETPVITESAADKLPEVPIMKGAYKLQYMRGGINIIYTVDGDIQSVVKFYTDTLASYGWMKTNSPDSAVGSIATMLRENEAKDRLSINMQENKKGGFITISISIALSQ